PLACFFFFQAEDGIRDFHVTGVQTCALPIFGFSLGETALAAFPRVALEAPSVPTVALLRLVRLRLAPCVPAGAPIARLERDAVEIGRASCRARVATAVGRGSLQTTHKERHRV